VIGHFQDGRALLSPSVATWGRGSPPTLGAFEVNAGSAAFIAAAKSRIKALEVAARSIGAPGIFDLGSSYGRKWDPLNDAVQALIADAQSSLAYGSPERAEMMSALASLNKAIFRVRSEASGDAYKLAMAAITMNPALAMEAIVRTAQSAGGLTQDAGAAVADLSREGCSLWRVMSDPVGFWNECVPWYARWGAYLFAGATALNAAGLLRGRR